MILGLVLLTEGTAAADLASGFAAACAALRPGDHLIVTDSGSDPDLTETLDRVAQPEALPAGAVLTVLRFGATPPGSPGAQANVALAEAEACETLLLLSASDPVMAEALNTARDRMAESGVGVLLAGGTPPPEALPDGEEDTQRRRDWLLTRAPAPLLLRRDWLLAQGLRLPESGPAAEWRWQLQICARAAPIGWQAAPLVHGPQPAALPPPLSGEAPCDADTLLALHQALTEELPADLAHGWLIGALAKLPPRLTAETRWQVAQQISVRLARCPDPLWQQIMAGQDHRQAALEADTLRRGQVLEVVALWTQTATEARLDRLETGLQDLQQGLAELAALRRGIDSLCRIAEYDALRPGWPAPGDDPAPDPEGRPA